MARLLVGLGLVLFFVAAQAAFTIGEWEQGMVVQFGNPKRIIQEPGLYFKLPGVVSTLYFLPAGLFSALACVSVF